MEPSPRRRVLLVIAGLPAGGAERQMSLLAKGLDRSQFEVGLLIFNSADKIHYRDVLESPLWFRALNLSPSKDGLMLVPRLISGVNKAIKDWQPDLVHTCLNVANHATRISSVIYRWRIPVVTSVRADFRNGYSSQDRIFERLLWRKSAYIICNSEASEKQLVADLGIPDSRILTIKNGIEEKFFSEDSVVPPDWWPKGKTCLLVARFKKDKNHLELIAAIKYLQDQKNLGDWHFVFVGEGPFKKDIEDAIQQAEIGDRVVLTTPVENLIPYYRAADVFILPSLNEGLSNVLLEAQASRLPIIVTHEANRAGAVNPENAYFITARGFGPELATALSADPNDRIERGNRISNDIRNRYRVENMVESTSTVWKHALEHHE